MDSFINNIFIDDTNFFRILSSTDSAPGSDQKTYLNFDANLKKHIARFPNSQVRSFLQPLIDNNLIKIAVPEKNKNLILGKVIITYETVILGVALNYLTHDIDFDGNSTNFDKVISSIYFIILEFILRENFKKEVLKDQLLLTRAEQYFEFVISKYLRLFELTGENKIAFSFLTKYFFKVYMCDLNPHIAYEKSTSPGDENTISERFPIAKLLKYKTILSLYDALYDFRVVNITPNNMKYLLTNNIGIFAFITLHASLSSFISAVVVSKYKHQNFAFLFISSDNVNAIEKIIIDKYLNRVSFDLETLPKILKTKSSV